MGRSRFDYHSYRGRRSASDWLKWIALTLAVLVVLVVAGLLWGQQYLKYTDKGLEFQPPFFSREEEKQDDTGEVNIVVGEPEEEEEEPSEPSQPEPSQTETGAAALQVSLGSVLDGSAAQQAAQAGADSVVVDMKTDAGALGWQSAQTLASARQPEAEGGEVNAKLTAWNEGDVYTVARLSCFRDEALGRDMSYTILTASGYRWMDGEESHWTSPARQQVRDYLVGLMVELAQMGFDEILLDHWGYPTQADGSLNNIQQGEDYTPQARAAAVEDFLAQARQALAPYGVKLSVIAGEDTVTGGETDSGGSAALLESGVDRLWMQGERSALLERLTQAGITQAEERLVCITQSLDPAQDTAQAVLQTAE